MRRGNRDHGNANDAKVAAGPTCPKLKNYWHFHGCRYDKISRTCSEPDHINGCPLPSHQLRNGRINQMAYSLFLFIRDIADGDLVGWIERQFQDADDPASPHRLARLREALISPLREAIALGLGTMVGWKRIVVTVGEKIGKTHLAYAQGACAEITAAATIAAADVDGLPVSTTHVLSSGIAGTMAANGSGLQLSTVRNIAMAWVLTLPAAMVISGTLYRVFSTIF